MNEKRKSNKFYEKKEHRIIYVMLSPFDNSFYITHSIHNRLKENYIENIKGRRYLSKKFIDYINPDRPCLFILENIYDTKSNAYNHILVWVKIFLENGYKSFNAEGIIEQTEYLYYENKELYEKRKNIDLKNILSCKNCMLPTYKNQTCKKFNPKTD